MKYPASDMQKKILIGSLLLFFVIIAGVLARPVAAKQYTGGSTGQPRAGLASYETSDDLEGAGLSHTYTYTAHTGDSYGNFARNATQLYAQEKSIALSDLQLLFIQKYLEKMANRPYLFSGQKVEIRQSSIQGALDKLHI